MGTPIAFDMWVSQDVDKGTLILGEKEGPAFSFHALLHEMCHLVEIDDERICYRGWGLRIPYTFVLGQTCVEPKTLQATEREMRVLAYQMNLTEHLGYKFQDRSITSLEYLYDFWDVGWTHARRYIRRGYQVREEKTKSWLCKQVYKLRDVYTYKRFELEWERKVGLLKAHKEDYEQRSGDD